MAAHQDSLEFAYNQCRYTDDAILTMLHRVYQHLEKPGTCIRLVFVDFSGAFNAIQPHIT